MADNPGQGTTLEDLRFALAAVENGDAQRIREAAVMSRAEMAAMCGVSERLITHYENRTRVVSPGVGRIYGYVLRRLQERAEQSAMPPACPACVVRDRLDHLAPLPHSCNACALHGRTEVFEMTGEQ